MKALGPPPPGGGLRLSGVVIPLEVVMSNVFIDSLVVIAIMAIIVTAVTGVF